MKKILSLVLVLALLVTSSACGSSHKFSGNTRLIDVVVGPGSIFKLPIPTELVTSETDNNLYWKFDDGSKLFITQHGDLTGYKVNDAGIYVANESCCKSIGDKDIFIQAEHSKVDALSQYIAQGQTVEVKTDLDPKAEIKKLDTYVDKSSEMSMSMHNLYMPAGVQETMFNIYKAELVCSGEKWLESWVMDGKLNEIKPTLITLACANSNSDHVTSWYEDTSLFMASAGDVCIYAKKLKLNEWYVYYGSSNYRDYIMTGVSKIHGK